MVVLSDILLASEPVQIATIGATAEPPGQASQIINANETFGKRDLLRRSDHETLQLLN